MVTKIVHVEEYLVENGKSMQTRNEDIQVELNEVEIKELNQQILENYELIKNTTN